MDARGQSWWGRWARRLWWLHSLWALAFGVGIMLFARRGLAYADTLLLIVGGAWLLAFVALRLVAGAGADDDARERLSHKGVRVVTNYVLKNLYQQMFFFQVPLYASSATWALESPNWWLPVLLLGCGVLSTMDLVFDEVLMRHRWAAALLYGVCLFALLNLVLPVTLRLSHLQALVVAALATPPATALLTFRVRPVLRPLPLLLVVVSSIGFAALAWVGRVLVPPAPLAMAHGAVGVGTPGSHEVLPGWRSRVRADELAGLRCATQIIDPSGRREPLVHVWRHGRSEIARLVPEELVHDEPASRVLRSAPEAAALPASPAGRWTCTVETEDGQIVGRVKFDVLNPR